MATSPYADRSWYDLCHHVYHRGEGWVCEQVNNTPPIVSNDILLRAGLILIACLVFLDFCRRWGRENGEKHGPTL